MTDTTFKKNYLKLITNCSYLSHTDKLEKVGLQHYRESSRGELTEATIHILGVSANKQSLDNSKALQLDGYHGAIKTGSM